MAMFLVVGCQATQSAEVEPPKVTVQKEVQKENNLNNPFLGIDIPPGAIIKSSKSVLCGEMGEILTNINKRFGEIPFMSGEIEVVYSSGLMKNILVILMVNPITNTYTFIEQMPNEERLMCILSAGKMYKGKDKKGT